MFYWHKHNNHNTNNLTTCFDMYRSSSGFILNVTKFLNTFFIKMLYFISLVPMLVFMGGGGVVVKALRYKPADRGFDSLWCHWNFSVT